LNSSVSIAGGVRTSNISVTDGLNSYKTVYKYGKDEDGIGTVSYIPALPKSSKDLSYSSQLASPKVMYDYVSAYSINSNNQLLNRTTYKFNTLKPIIEYNSFGSDLAINDFFEYNSTTTSINHSNGNRTISIGNFNIEDNWSSLGQLMEVKSYNEANNVLSIVNYNYYKKSEIIPNNAGIDVESYQTYKILETDEEFQYKWLIGSTSKKTYSSILKSSTTTIDGYSYTTEYHDYDLISGISKEQIHTSSDGRVFKTRVVPAYHKYSGMGSKRSEGTRLNSSHVKISYAV